MKRKTTLRTVLLLILLLLVAIQFIPVDRSVPEHKASEDFITMTNPPENIRHNLEVACYDCHSFNTRYPWYSYISPVSIWLQDHIDHGRDELNFSRWGQYPEDKADHKLEECAELVSESAMPLNSYLWVHTDARLSDADRKEMADWFNSLRRSPEVEYDDDDE